MARIKIPKATALEVLRLSSRRCAFCFGLQHDFSQKKGQIAHLNHNNADNTLPNLVYLCLQHHEEYDSSSRQSKQLTSGEALVYRNELYTLVKKLRDSLLLHLEKSIPTKNQAQADFSLTNSKKNLKGLPFTVHFDSIFENFEPLGEKHLIEPGIYCKRIAFAWGQNEGDDFIGLFLMEYDFSKDIPITSEAFMVLTDPEESQQLLRRDKTMINLKAFNLTICINRPLRKASKIKISNWLNLRAKRVELIAHELEFVRDILKGKKLSSGPAFSLGILGNNTAKYR